MHSLFNQYLEFFDTKVCLFVWGLTSYSGVFPLYDDRLSTSHCTLPYYGGKTMRKPRTKTPPTIAGVTTCDSLIYLMVNRRTRSRERLTLRSHMFLFILKKLTLCGDCQSRFYLLVQVLTWGLF